MIYDLRTNMNVGHLSTIHVRFAEVNGHEDDRYKVPRLWSSNDS